MCSNTPFEKYLEGIINTYHQYSVRVEHFDMLSKGELKKMMEEQMTTFLKSQKDPKAIDRIFDELDKDKNKQLSFEETMALIVRVLIFCHNKIHDPHHGHSHGPGQDHSHSH